MARLDFFLELFPENELNLVVRFTNVELRKKHSINNNIVDFKLFWCSNFNYALQIHIMEWSVLVKVSVQVNQPSFHDK